MFSTTQKSCQPVLQDGELRGSGSTAQSSSMKTSPLARYIFVSLALLSIISCIVIIASRRAQHYSWSSCGSTATQARDRGCSFDLISFAWQTPECYDAPLVSEFAAWDSWEFYTEPFGTVTVPLQDAMRGEQSLWVPWRYHVVHCTLMWRQMHRAYENGWIDAHMHAYNHTMHCQKVLLRKGIDEEEVSTRAAIIFPVCERVGSEVGSEWFNHVYT
jgi:hypothetical protein